MVNYASPYLGIDNARHTDASTTRSKPSSELENALARLFANGLLDKNGSVTELGQRNVKVYDWLLSSYTIHF